MASIATKLIASCEGAELEARKKRNPANIAATTMLEANALK